MKRAAMAVVGGALVLGGLRRRSIGGLLAGIAGGWLLYRAVDGGSRGSRTDESSAGGGQETETGTSPVAVDVERSVTVRESADELYDRWQDPETHERMWAHFAEVTPTGNDRQHWTVRGPVGVAVEWDAEVVEKRPGEMLRWESLPGATVPNEGTVRFRSRGNGDETEVRLKTRFEPPGGRLSAAAAKRLDVVPDTAAGTALRRFKSLVETGEVPTLERNPSARGQGDLV